MRHGIGGAGAQALNALDVEPFGIGPAIVLLGAAPLMVRYGEAFVGSAGLRF